MAWCACGMNQELCRNYTEVNVDINKFPPLPSTICIIQQWDIFAIGFLL